MVTYNRLETLKIALEHILSQTIQPSSIVIVDNNSYDGTQDYLHTINGRNNIHCIFMNSNTGSAGAIAEAMKFGLLQGTYDYFWVLDDDTFYASNALQDLIENIQQTDFTMLGLHGAKVRWGKKLHVDPKIKLQEVDYAMIDGALIKADVVRVLGPLCADFFMMCDDHEYSVRLRRNGFKIGVLKNGADNRLVLGGAGQFTKSTLWRGYYSARNHMFIIKKHFSFTDLIGYVYHQVKLLAIAAIFAPDRFSRVKFRLLGIWHGILGVSGRTLDPGTLKFGTRKSGFPTASNLLIHLPLLASNLYEYLDTGIDIL